MASMRAMMQSVSLQEQYDENAKWLISQKPFLANILVRTVKEFEGLDPKEVEKLIEGNPSVGATPVEEGLTNEKREDGTTEISGMNTEKRYTMRVWSILMFYSMSECIRIWRK